MPRGAVALRAIHGAGALLPGARVLQRRQREARSRRRFRNRPRSLRSLQPLRGAAMRAGAGRWRRDPGVGRHRTHGGNDSRDAGGERCAARSLRHPGSQRGPGRKTAGAIATIAGAAGRAGGLARSAAAAAHSRRDSGERGAGCVAVSQAQAEWRCRARAGGGGGSRSTRRARGDTGCRSRQHLRSAAARAAATAAGGIYLGGLPADRPVGRGALPTVSSGA